MNVLGIQEGMLEKLRKTTLADIVTNNIRSAIIFEELRLDFCCKGRRTLEEACAGKKLDVKKGATTEAIYKVLEAEGITIRQKGRARKPAEKPKKTRKKKEKPVREKKSPESKKKEEPKVGEKAKEK